MDLVRVTFKRRPEKGAEKQFKEFITALDSLLVVKCKDASGAEFTARPTESTNSVLKRHPDATLHGVKLVAGKHVKDYCKESDRFHIIFNVMAIDRPLDKHYKDSLVAWMRDSKPDIIVLIRKSAIATSSMFVKVFLKAVFAIQPPTSNPTVYTKLDAALKGEGYTREDMQRRAAKRSK